MSKMAILLRFNMLLCPQLTQFSTPKSHFRSKRLIFVISGLFPAHIQIIYNKQFIFNVVLLVTNLCLTQTTHFQPVQLIWSPSDPSTPDFILHALIK